MTPSVKYFLRQNLAVVVVLLAGCGSTWSQSRGADRTGHAVDAAITALAARYLAAGYDAIDHASTAASAQSALEQTRDRWRPLWAALARYAAAHDRWASTLESGSAIDPEDATESYCDLLVLIRELAAGVATELPTVGCLP